ncbi:MAG: hypothetical protein ABI391_04080 [Hyphomicrobiaceae bacterium]
MQRYHLSAAVGLAALIVGATCPARAGTFDVKDPEITKGETEISTNHTVSSGFPAYADRIRHSFELAAGYAFTDNFKAGAKFGFDTYVGDDPQLSTAGVEGQIFLGKFGPAVTLAWYTGLDVGIHHGETNTLAFGPLIKFGDEKLALTLNPLFEQTLGANREHGIGFAYAVGLKSMLREGLGLGVEAHGSIPDIGDPPAGQFHEHRIGPVLYIDREISPARDGQSARKLSLEIGTFVGLTDATPDWSGKVKAALTW